MRPLFEDRLMTRQNFRPRLPRDAILVNLKVYPSSDSLKRHVRMG